MGIQSREEERREKFVDSLLEAHNFSLTALPSGKRGAFPLVDSCVKANVVKSNHSAKSMFLGFSLSRDRICCLNHIKPWI